MKRGILAFLVAALGSGVAQAGNITCSGTVEEISFHATNLFYIRLSSMNTAVAFCDPDASYNAPGSSHATGPQTCKAMLATFIAARESGREVTNVIFDGDSAPGSCNTWAVFQGANIRFYKY